VPEQRQQHSGFAGSSAQRPRCCPCARLGPGLRPLAARPPSAFGLSQLLHPDIPHACPCPPPSGLPHAQHQDRVCILPFLRPHALQPAGLCARVMGVECGVQQHFGNGRGGHCKWQPTLCAACRLLLSPRFLTVILITTMGPATHRPFQSVQEVTDQIRQRTGHLPGVSIAVMGCIVNGPGEMADADFGWAACFCVCVLCHCVGGQVGVNRVHVCLGWGAGTWRRTLAGCKRQSTRTNGA
jgi:hypothetical protein